MIESPNNKKRKPRQQNLYANQQKRRRSEPKIQNKAIDAPANKGREEREPRGSHT